MVADRQTDRQSKSEMSMTFPWGGRDLIGAKRTEDLPESKWRSFGWGLKKE